MNIISVKDLVKYYGDFPAVEGISFELGENESIGLLGLNGAGKTTVLRIIAGFLIPSAGNIKITGYNIVENPLEIKKQLGYLPETPPLYSDMCVSEYLYFVGGIKGINNQELKNYVDKALIKASLTEVKSRLIRNLSLGFRKRVGIAQAIIHEPKIVILDEPISGLDPKQIIEMRILINNLKNEHSFIISSHILSEVSKICDRFLIMHKGKIIREESNDTLLSRVGRIGAYEIGIKCPNTMNLESTKNLLRKISGLKDIQIQKETENSYIINLFLENGKSENPISWKKELVLILAENSIDLIYLKPGKTELESLFMELMK